MRAAVYRETGPGRDALRIEEISRPAPGPGEVLVRIHASGVNPTDHKTRSGATWRPVDEFQVPHQDGAGVIEAVGPGVDGLRVGQRAWVWLAPPRRGRGNPAGDPPRPAPPARPPPGRRPLDPWRPP